MRAVLVREPGGPEVLEVVDVEPPRPGPAEVLVEVAASGINFMDVYMRAGIGAYARPTPFVLGSEGAGRIVELGEGVSDLHVGDRVAWKAGPGSFAERVVVAAAEAVPVPDGVSEEVAAAVMLQGLTAHYLCSSTCPVQQGDTVLVHAAAGGVGLLLTQMVGIRGGRTIGTVSTAEKEALARRAGAAEVIRYDQRDVAPAVRDLTGGEGVAAAYDGVGRATFDQSVASTRIRGTVVLFGGSSGQVPPFDLQRLNAAGSLYVTRPTLVHYTRTREELLWRAGEIFDWIAAGRLDVHIGGRYLLEQAPAAFEDLEGRRTVGKLLLLPR